MNYCMQFLTDLLVGVLTIYLSFTNALADGISGLLPEEKRDSTVSYQQPLEEKEEGGSTIQTLETEYQRGISLPDILIQNAAYQKASVADSTSTSTTTKFSVEDALVNIYCTYTTDGYVRTNTGTGFFISPEGVILTNAHVAQFLLLETVNETGETSCIVRAGNPAEPLYEAELLYISPAWIQKHANLINDLQPRGTGERDYALLFVRAGLDNRPLPGQFPFLLTETSLMSNRMQNANVTAGGYPAETLFKNGPEAKLVPVLASTTITDIYTFGSSYADIFSLGESKVGEHGASGGPVLNQEGKVIGLITTKGSNEDGASTLRALTLSYIDRTIIEESTFNLQQTISGQLAFRSQLFQKTIVPFLSRLVESEIE